MGVKVWLMVVEIVFMNRFMDMIRDFIFFGVLEKVYL